MQPRRRSRVVAALALVAGLAVPSAGLAQQDESAAEESLRDEVDRTDEQLADAQARLDAARARLEAADRAEQAALGALAAMADQVAEADARARAATEEAAALAAVLVEQQDRLASERAGLAHGRAELERRVVWMWKHGAAASTAMWMRIGAGASHPHDVVVGRHVVDRVVSEDQGEVARATRRVAAAVAARAPDVDLRDLARRAAFTAREEAAVLEALRRKQLAVVEELAEIRSQREAVFAALQADRDALAALAIELRRTLARVGVEQALVPPADLPLDGPPPPWADLLPGGGRGWARATEATAVRNGVDGALFSALVWSESGFRPGVVSHAGAIGLAQLMPGTARMLGVDPYDPYQNLDGGSRYLRDQVATFGRVDLGLAAYNAGPGRVRGAGNAVPNIAETQLYVIRVLERWALLRDAG